MRSIPFAIICCIGMNDGAFPRQSYRPSWDLMAEHPRRGDRSVDREDRYLFLETILSARKRLYLSCIGRSARDNAPQGPSVVVDELLSAIDRGFRSHTGDGGPARTAVTVEHPLQAWNPRCFADGDRLRSFSGANTATRGPAVTSGTGSNRLFTERLPAGPAEEAVDLQAFIDFFRNPVNALLANRLGMRLPGKQEEAADTECFELDGLDRYGVAQQLTGVMLGGGNPEEAFTLLRAKGDLPPGSAGRFCFDDLAAEIRPFIETLRPLLAGEPALPPLIVRVPVGPLVIAGSIDNCRSSVRLAWRFADAKAKDCLAAWINHLLLCAHHRPGYPTTTRLIAKDETIVLSPVPDAEAKLTLLASCYREGMRSPLPFFPDTSLDYAERVVVKKQSPRDARTKAMGIYNGNDYNRGEGDDPWFAFCFRPCPAFDAAWERLALDIWTPFFAASQVQP
jgi:exodeoxyribonuclease V gamma subunit